MEPGFQHSGEFYSLVCAFLWASSVILYRRSGDRLPPLFLNVFKTGIGVVLFVLTMFLAGIPFFPGEASTADWLLLVFSGALGIGAADTLIFASLNRIGAGRFGIVDCAYSPSVVLFSFMFLDEPMPAGLFVAIALMSLAILLGAWEPSRAGTRSGRSIKAGLFMGVGAVVLTALAIVAVKPLLDRSSVWWVSLWRLVAGFVVLLVHAALASRSWRFKPMLLERTTWTIALPASILGTYLAFYFWNLGMKYTHTTVASVLNQSSNVFILIMAWLFLRERLARRHWAAVMLGVAGGVVVLM